jgi:hypothetical protein
VTIVCGSSITSSHCLAVGRVWCWTTAATVYSDIVGLTRYETHELHDHSSSVDRRKLYVDDLFAEGIQHLLYIDKRIWIVIGIVYQNKLIKESPRRKFNKTYPWV